MSHSEATFNNSILFPCLLATIYLLRKKTVLGPVFVPGEEPLQAMSRVLDKKDGRKTYHADAIFRLENLSGLEVLLLETAESFNVANERKIAFDNTKGMFALLALMTKEGSLVENPGRQCLTPFPLRLLHDSKSWSSFPPSKR